MSIRIELNEIRMTLGPENQAEALEQTLKILSEYLYQLENRVKELERIGENPLNPHVSQTE